MAGRLYQFVKPSGAGHVCGQWVVIKYQFRDVDHTAAKMGATTQQTPQQAPQIQPVQRPVTQPMQTQPVTEQPVQMENGRIVYNRQYGNIPKGSYTGGSTYTVKKGDTLLHRPDYRERFPRSGPEKQYFCPV